MSTVPADPAGAVARTWLAESEVILPAVEPNLTEEALARFVPARVTLVPAVVGPALGLTELTEGRAA